MGQKIKKASLLEEIDAKIKSCELYQAKQPDESAEKRVAVLDKNPCTDGDYHTVITLKSPVTEPSSDPKLLLTKREDKFLDVCDAYFSKIFECGCIIKYDLKSNKITVTKYTSSQLSQLFEKLIECSIDARSKILTFQPSKASLFKSYKKYSCLLDDYNSWINSAYDTLYYSIGRFKNISSFLDEMKLYDKNDKQVLSYAFPFEKVSYINPTKRSSFEKNVNEEIDAAILNEVTNFNKKTNEAQAELTKEHIVDFGNFIINRIDELEKSDYQITLSYSQNHRSVDFDTAMEDAYYAFGGPNISSPPILSWEIAASNFMSLKSVAQDGSSKKYESFKKDYPTTFEAGKAYEKVNFLMNSGGRGVRGPVKYFVKEADQKPLNVSFKSETINNYIKTHFTDRIQFVVKPVVKCGNIDLILNKENLYNITVPIREWETGSISEGRVVGEFKYFHDQETLMKKVRVTVKAENIVQVNRDQVFIDGNLYKLTKNQIPLTDGGSALNEVDQSSGKEFPANSYFNDGLKTYFKAEDLVKRMCNFRINYSLIPLKVDVTFKIYCAETSKYKETCVAALNTEVQKRGDTILRACVDTIPFDPWERVKDKLKKVYYAFSKIPENKEGYILVPPVESDPVKAAASKCKKCGKTKDVCECVEPKLCDKIFPLDLFGVTGLLGLDELLSKFGLFTVKSYILNQNDQKVTYSEMAEYLYNENFVTFGYPEAEGIWEFEDSSSDPASLVCKLTYEDLAICPDCQVKNSILNQLTEKDFNNFKKKYVELLNAGDVEKLAVDTVSRELGVGIADGYAYIPTGKSVTYVFNLMKSSFSIKGWGNDPLTMPAQLKLFELIGSLNKIGCEEYVKKAEALQKEMKMAFDLSEDAQINLVYPYLPKIETIIGGGGGDTESELEGYNFAFMYIPNPTSVKKFIKELGSPKDLEIIFDIYRKEAIKCGYPKDANPKCRSDESGNGKCGLEELFKGVVEASPVKFDFDTELRQLKDKVLSYRMMKESDELKNNVKKLSSFACDVQKNLEDVITSKNDALDALYTVGAQLQPLLNLFPVKCLSDAMNDGKNAICSASRKVQDKSVIDDFGDSVSHKLKTIGVVANDAWAAGKQRVNELTDGFKNSVGPIKESLGKLWDNASIYNLCPNRFSDYISDSGIAKSFGEGLTGIMKNSTIGVLKSVLGSCMVDGVIDSALGGIASIADFEKGNIKRILEEGDPAAIERLGEQFPELLEKFGSAAPGGGLDFNKLMSAPSFDTSFLQSFETEIAKRMNPGSLMSSVKDKFTDPKNLISFAQSGVKSLIKGGAGDMTSSIMQQANGLGLDAVSSTLQVNASDAVKDIFTKEDAHSSVNFDIISSLNSYVREKAELYSVIKGGEEIPNL